MLRIAFLILLFASNLCYAADTAKSEISEIIGKSSGIPSSQQLSEYIKKHKFGPWLPDNTFYSVIKYTDDPYLPEMELILVFYKKMLFSIITTAPIELKKSKSEIRAGASYIYYLSDDTSVITLFEEKYLQGLTFAG